MNNMNRIILVIPALLALTLASAIGAPHAFAHHDPHQNNIQPFQQTCFNDPCAAGYTDGENQAANDWNNGYKNPNQNCPTDQPHSHDYCSQYWLGYGDEWNRSIQQNQEQGASVNIKGNNNKVNIEQGELSTDNGFSGSSSHSSSSHGLNPKCVLICVGIN
jgi:hypothetical protein